jgi:hypothetical protein
MRFGLLCSAAVIAAGLVSGTVFAQANAIKAGVTVVDANGKKIAKIDKVTQAADGSVADVAVIYEGRIVHIPGNTLTAGDDKVTTSLTRADVSKLK